MKENNFSNPQIISLTMLRVLIGWHFLYEGLIKLFTPGWTSFGYLTNSVGPVSPILKMLTTNQTVLSIVDYVNMWGLVLIGLSLFIGLFSRYFRIFGIVLIFLYYIAYPPFAGFSINSPTEGSYWIVNKNLIEMAALFVLYFFPTSHITGLDLFVKKLISKENG